MKKRATISSIGFVMCFILAVLANASDGADAVIQRFASDASLAGWTAVDRATIAYEGDHLTITQPKYDGSEHAWPRAEKDVSDYDFARFNGIQVTVENPNDAIQTMDIVVLDGQGATAYLSAPIASGSRQTVRLRFEKAYNEVDWSNIRRLSFMRTQPEATYVWHIHEISLFADVPERTPRAAADAIMLLAQKEFDAIKPLMDSSFHDEVQQRLNGWKEAMKTSEAMRGRLAECRVELAKIASDALRFNAANGVKNQNDPSLLVWAVAPGETFRPDEAFLQYRSPAAQLSIHAAKGEYGDAIVRLTNVGSKVQELRLTVQSPEDSTLPALTIRRNVPVVARDRTRCGDALVPLDSAGIVTLPALETVELWVRADMRHESWSAGEHQFTLEVRNLREAGAPTTTVPIVVRVFNIDLNAARPMRMHVWPELSHPRSWIVHGREDAARNNMMDYGTNVMTMVGSDLPWPKFTPNGDIESIDFTQHDRAIQFVRKSSSPMLLFWMEMDADKTENWGLRAGFEPGSEKWKRALSNWLSVWTKHLSEMGLSTEDYAFYVTDEPNLGELERTLSFASVAKSVSSAIQIYVNHTGELWEDQAKNDRLLELTDIWQPDESHFSTNQRQILGRHHHLEQWIYRCSMSRRTYDVNAYDYYRLMTWRAIRDGITGIAYWTYCATHPEEDPWDGTKGVASEGILIYPDTGKGLIMSARWEQVRMGLDDARYADLLRRAEPRDDAQRQAVTTLLNERLAEIISNPTLPELAVQWRIDAGSLLENMKQPAQ